MSKLSFFFFILLALGRKKHNKYIISGITTLDNKPYQQKMIIDGKIITPEGEHGKFEVKGHPDSEIYLGERKKGVSCDLNKEDHTQILVACSQSAVGSKSKRNAKQLQFHFINIASVFGGIVILCGLCYVYNDRKPKGEDWEVFLDVEDI